MATRWASWSGFAPPLAGGLGRMRSSGALSILAVIGNELQQRTVGIAEIDADAGPFGAEALDRPGVNRDPAALKVDDGVRNRPVPLEAEIAVAGLDRKPRHLGRMKAGPVQIELRRAEPVGPALRAPNELGAEKIAAERVRALPVRDMYHAVVEGDGQWHGHSSSAGGVAAHEKGPKRSVHAIARHLDRKSTRLKLQSHLNLVCRLLLEKKKT